MNRYSVGRNVFWGLALALAFTVIALAAGQCTAPVGAVGAQGLAPNDPILVTFLGRYQTPDRIRYDYGITATGTVVSLTVNGPCLIDTGGMIVRNNGSEQLTYLETGFVRSLDGATITIKYAPTKYTVVGVWVGAEYPGGLAENSRWANFPLWVYTEGNPEPYTQIVPQCDQSPIVLPLVTSGPAEPGFIVFIGIAIVILLALNSNKRPQPPHR